MIGRKMWHDVLLIHANRVSFSVFRTGDKHTDLKLTVSTNDTGIISSDLDFFL